MNRLLDVATIAIKPGERIELIPGRGIGLWIVEEHFGRFFEASRSY